MTEHSVLDLLGEVCPVPLLRVREAVEHLSPGESVVVETDFPRAVRNISQWCMREGHGCQIDGLASGTWQVTVTRKRIE